VQQLAASFHRAHRGQHELLRLIKDEFDPFLGRNENLAQHITRPRARPTRTIHRNVELAGDVRVG
jgi:hypothetical protein